MVDRPGRFYRCMGKWEERRQEFNGSKGKSVLDQAWASWTKHYDGTVFM